MKISAIVNNSLNQHSVTVNTNNVEKSIDIPCKETGYGSSINGGELLMLALATCYCNDIYREAAKRNIAVTHVQVECMGEFGAAGEPGYNFSYKATVDADASSEEIDELIKYTDTVAEIQNTLRKGVNISLIG